VSYELILPPDTRTEIQSYLSERFERPLDRLRAWDQIEAELQKLAANPALGSAPRGGPFESRPIYRFAITVDDTTRYIQVVYKIHREERLVVVSGFAPVQL